MTMSVPNSDVQPVCSRVPSGERIASPIEPVNRDLASDLLVLPGFQVLEAENAQAGIARARRESPDPILIDLGLSDLDGPEASRQLKADPATSGIPVVAHTEHAMPGDEAKARSAGCIGYNAKPIDTRKFAEKVNTYVVDAR